MLPPKPAVLAALRSALEAELAALESVAAQARDEVTSPETRQEGMYDTRATEASYLARGQAERIGEVRRLLAWAGVFDASVPMHPPVVQTGALVCLEGPRSDVVFVAPAGGNRLRVGGVSVSVVSPSSPLGLAMTDLEAGDAFEVDSPTGVAEYKIVALR